MSRQVKFRRGTAAQHSTFTGANGEVTVDTTNKTLRVHDGATAGGFQTLTTTAMFGRWDPRWSGAVGDGVADDRSAFFAAASLGKTLVVSAGIYKISSSLTIGPDVEFIGGVLSIDAGVVVTFTGAVRSTLKRLFTGAGTVVFGKKQVAAYPEWFGALDGTGADGAAIRRCLDACRGNKVTTWFTNSGYQAEAGADLTLYPDTPVKSAPKALINGVGATTGFTLSEGNYGGALFELPALALFPAFALKLQNCSLANVRVPSIAVASVNDGLVIEANGDGKTVLDNKVEIHVISQITSNAILLTATHANNVIQGNEVYVNFVTSALRTVCFFSTVTPNWDSNKFVFQAIDPANISGATGLANLSPGAVPRTIFRCETWCGGFPSNGIITFGAFNGLDMYLNMAEAIGAYTKWQLSGIGNKVETGFSGYAPSQGRAVASNTANSKASWNSGTPIDVNLLRARITLGATVADGAIFNAYIYHPFADTDLIRVAPVSMNGFMFNVVGRTANDDEILLQIMNVSGASKASGQNIDFDLVVGVV